MHLPTIRSLLAASAAGAALVLLGACSGGGAKPVANPAPNTSSAAVAASASGTPTAGGASQAPGSGGGGASGSSGGKSGSGQPAGGSSGGGVPAGAASSVPKPCTLLSGGEAGSAMHVTGTLTTKINTADECEYDAANGASVDIAVQAVPFTPDLPNAIAQIAPAGQVKRINGIGDAAILFTPAASQAQLYLWKHGLAVTINVDGATSAGTAATSMATTVAGRI